MVHIFMIIRGNGSWPVLFRFSNDRESLRSVSGRALRPHEERNIDFLKIPPFKQRPFKLHRKQSFGHTSGYRCPADGKLGKSVYMYARGSRGHTHNTHTHTYHMHARVYYVPW